MNKRKSKYLAYINSKEWKEKISVSKKGKPSPLKGKDRSYKGRISPNKGKGKPILQYDKIFACL